VTFKSAGQLHESAAGQESEQYHASQGRHESEEAYHRRSLVSTVRMLAVMMVALRIEESEA
jgi:hypothetical protein